MLLEVAALILVVLFCVTINAGMGSDVWRCMVDPPTLLLILLSILPAVLIHGMWKDLIRAVKLQKKSFTCSLNEMKNAQYAVEFLQKSLLWGGGIITMIGLINLFVSIPGGDYSWMLGPAMAVASIPLMYVAMLEFLLLPLEIVVKRRILEYLKEE